MDGAIWVGQYGTDRHNTTDSSLDFKGVWTQRNTDRGGSFERAFERTAFKSSSTTAHRPAHTAKNLGNHTWSDGENHVPNFT
ncbi:hypothetical protein MRX96_055063 [Rhipicephalus microplus]